MGAATTRCGAELRSHPPQRPKPGAILVRTLRSAVTVLRRKGLSAASDLTRLRAAEFYLAHRPIPGDPERRLRLLADTLNRWSGVSAVALSIADVADVRRAMLVPYLRHRFAEVAAAAPSASPRPVEVAILADCLFATWDFEGISAALPGWTRIVEGTRFALRVAQTGRRAALRLGRLTDAARGLERGGDDVGSLLVEADISDALGRMDEAGRAYEAAVHRDGSDPYARQSHAFHLLKAGRVRDGLASWSAADRLFGDYPLRRHRPHWAGEPLADRRLMVLFEHGLGDMIQVARFLPRLRAREPGASLLARVPAPLAGLLRRAFPSVVFVTEDEREPDYDLFVPSMQLAAVLDAPDLEPRGHYIGLGAPAARTASARPRVGVCWRGHPRQYEATRSIPLGVFERLFAIEGVDFVVLLNRLTAAEQARLEARAAVAVPRIEDFLGLASLVASCDLVVTVDTAVAHLAGAGGVPTLLLSRPDACWRWGAAGSRGPWYDGVEVLRHPGDMDWPRLLAVAARRIAALVPAVTGR